MKTGEHLRTWNPLTQAFVLGGQNEFLLFVQEDRRLSYIDVLRLSAEGAEYYEAMGIRAGTPVGVVFSNTVDAVVTYYALLKLKATAILLDPLAKPPEIERMLRMSNSQFFLAPHEFADWSRSSRRCDLFNTKTVPTGNASLKYFEFPEFNPDYELAVLFTSGSRGGPKGVKLKYEGWLRSALVFGEKCYFTEKTRLLQVMPLHHGTGWFTSLIVPVLFGSSVVLMSKFDTEIAKSYWDFVDQYEVNYLIVIPAILSALLSAREPDQRRHENMLANCSSSLLLPELKRSFEGTFGVKIIEDYSTTEAGIIAISALNQQNDSVGILAGISDVKFSDEGEILVKNGHLFGGYIDEGRDAIRSEYYCTGDLGEIREGFLYLKGRRDDLIIRNGMNILPQEIDRAILKYGGHNVSEAYTVSLRDDLGNDRIYSFVVSPDESGSEDFVQKLMVFLRSQISDRKLPDAIIQIEAIPKTSVGKPSKQELTRIANDMFGKRNAG